jgi:hypothetical protein
MTSIGTLLIEAFTSPSQMKNREISNFQMIDAISNDSIVKPYDDRSAGSSNYTEYHAQYLCYILAILQLLKF